MDSRLRMNTHTCSIVHHLIVVIPIQVLGRLAGALYTNLEIKRNVAKNESIICKYHSTIYDVCLYIK